MIIAINGENINEFEPQKISKMYIEKGHKRCDDVSVRPKKKQSKKSKAQVTNDDDSVIGDLPDIDNTQDPPLSPQSSLQNPRENSLGQSSTTNQFGLGSSQSSFGANPHQSSLGQSPRTNQCRRQTNLSVKHPKFRLFDMHFFARDYHFKAIHH